MAKLNFGKHAGLDLQDVPGDYLKWLIETRKKDIAGYEEELKRRELVEIADLSIGEKILAAGYKALALKAHPDTGGSTVQFQELNAAYEQLKVVVKEVRNVQGTNSK